MEKVPADEKGSEAKAPSSKEGKTKDGSGAAADKKKLLLMVKQQREKIKKLQLKLAESAGGKARGSAAAVISGVKSVKQLLVLARTGSRAADAGAGVDGGPTIMLRVLACAVGTLVGRFSRAYGTQERLAAAFGVWKGAAGKGDGDGGSTSLGEVASLKQVQAKNSRLRALLARSQAATNRLREDMDSLRQRSSEREAALLEDMAELHKHTSSLESQVAAAALTSDFADDYELQLQKATDAALSAASTASAASAAAAAASASAAASAAGALVSGRATSHGTGAAGGAGAGGAGTGVLGLGSKEVDYEIRSLRGQMEEERSLHEATSAAQSHQLEILGDQLATMRGQLDRSRAALSKAENDLVRNKAELLSTRASQRDTETELRTLLQGQETLRQSLKSFYASQADDTVAKLQKRIEESHLGMAKAQEAVDSSERKLRAMTDSQKKEDSAQGRLADYEAEIKSLRAVIQRHRENRGDINAHGNDLGVSMGGGVGLAASAAAMRKADSEQGADAGAGGPSGLSAEEEQARAAETLALLEDMAHTASTSMVIRDLEALRSRGRALAALTARIVEGVQQSARLEASDLERASPDLVSSDLNLSASSGMQLMETEEEEDEEHALDANKGNMVAKDDEVQGHRDGEVPLEWQNIAATLEMALEALIEAKQGVKSEDALDQEDMLRLESPGIIIRPGESFECPMPITSAPALIDISLHLPLLNAAGRPVPPESGPGQVQQVPPDMVAVVVKGRADPWKAASGKQQPELARDVLMSTVPIFIKAPSSSSSSGGTTATTSEERNGRLGIFVNEPGLYSLQLQHRPQPHQSSGSLWGSGTAATTQAQAYHVVAYNVHVKAATAAGYVVAEDAEALRGSGPTTGDQAADEALASGSSAASSGDMVEALGEREERIEHLRKEALVAASRSSKRRLDATSLCRRWKKVQGSLQSADAALESTMAAISAEDASLDTFLDPMVGPLSSSEASVAVSQRPGPSPRARSRSRSWDTQDFADPGRSESLVFEEVNWVSSAVSSAGAGGGASPGEAMGTVHITAGREHFVRFRVEDTDLPGGGELEAGKAMEATETSKPHVWRLRWRWYTKTPGLGLGFAMCHCSPDGALPQVVPFSRVTRASADAPHEGSVIVSRPGDYAALFDNSHSWLRTQALAFTIHVDRATAPQPSSSPRASPTLKTESAGAVAPAALTRGSSTVTLGGPTAPMIVLTSEQGRGEGHRSRRHGQKASSPVTSQQLLSFVEEWKQAHQKKTGNQGPLPESMLPLGPEPEEAVRESVKAFTTALTELESAAHTGLVLLRSQT